MGICGQCGNFKNKRNDKNKIEYIKEKDPINCSIQKNDNEICFNFPILEDKPNARTIKKKEGKKEQKNKVVKEKFDKNENQKMK